MAQELPTERPDFGISVQWPPSATTGGDAVLDASTGRLTISVSQTDITSYRTDKGLEGKELIIPLYSLAEWIAANWWALLYEPAKTDDSENDFGFRSRHWLGTARDGFALPDLWLLPSGDLMRLLSKSRYLRHAHLEFVHDVDESVPTALVRSSLATFVSGVMSRLEEAGIQNTIAQQAWELVLETAPDEEEYCRLVGSLGLSPYDEHPQIDRVLEEISGRLSDSVLSDLCQASPPKKFESLAAVTSELVQALPNTQPINLSKLIDVPPPRDGKPEAWKWGKEAAAVVRERLGISSKDPKGGSAILDAVNFGIDSTSIVSSHGIDVNQVAAGLARQDREMQLSIVESASAQKRFAATRAMFLGWAGASGSSRLVTGAKTRDQQASRAFAAELLAPVAYLRAKAGDKKRLTPDRLTGIASELDVSLAVLQYQAQNNQLLGNY